jgi:hypothetical protein
MTHFLTLDACHCGRSEGIDCGAPRVPARSGAVIKQFGQLDQPVILHKKAAPPD